jgi:hypothetical protein
LRGNLCNSHDEGVKLASGEAWQGPQPATAVRHADCLPNLPAPIALTPGDDFMQPMDLTIWLPALFVLGLAVMGLLFTFIAACERI